MKKQIAIIGLIGCMLVGCGGESQTVQPIESAVVDTQDSTEFSEDKSAASEDLENAEETDNSTSNNSAIDTKEDHEYVHGEDGYFSLADNGTITTVKSQLSGTCWVTAAATALESAYKLDYGQDIEIDFVDMLLQILGNPDNEGYYAKEGTDIYDIGGTCWQLTETFSNGYGDYILVDATDLKEESRDIIKEFIQTKGAISVGMNDTKYWRIDGYKTLRATENDDMDHAVTLIGWDDNFPKEYFSNEATQNGAWLAQNTRSEYWGNGGRFWVSYDTPFDELLKPEFSKEYSKVVAYDAGNENTISTGNQTTTANKFHEVGKLKAIGTYITQPNQDILIEIFDADMNNLIYSQEAQMRYKGYHVIELDKTLDVSDFSIAITYSGKAPVEGESWDDHGICYSVGSTKGESFVKINDKWCDISEEATIKKLGIDFIPNNCCIKAIF